MVTQILFSIIISLLFFLGIVYFLSKKFQELESARKGDSGMQLLNQNMQALQRLVSDQINSTTRSVNERLDYASRVMMAINGELGQMREIGSNLKNIQDFLKSPKLRGNLGEQGLKELLSQAIPTKYFDLQYSFRSGVKVDAIIHLDAGKIPIDSKFPLENFNQMLKAQSEQEKLGYLREFKRDFKKHVEAISTKYINPDEGTTDFAFMYIPSESIYFEVVNNQQDLFEYAAANHIIVSSPSTFFYYLRTIMLGLEGKRITELSREILKTLKTIKQQSNILGENMSVLGKHLGNANKTFSAVADQFNKLADKIDKIDTLEENKNNLIEEEYNNATEKS